MASGHFGSYPRRGSWGEGAFGSAFQRSAAELSRARGDRRLGGRCDPGPLPPALFGPHRMGAGRRLLSSRETRATALGPAPGPASVPSPAERSGVEAAGERALERLRTPGPLALPPRSLAPHPEVSRAVRAPPAPFEPQAVQGILQPQPQPDRDGRSPRLSEPGGAPWASPRRAPSAAAPSGPGPPRRHGPRRPEWRSRRQGQGLGPARAAGAATTDG